MFVRVYGDSGRLEHMARGGVGTERCLVLEILVLKVGRKSSMTCARYLLARVLRG